MKIAYSRAGIWPLPGRMAPARRDGMLLACFYSFIPETRLFIDRLSRLYTIDIMRNYLHEFEKIGMKNRNVSDPNGTTLRRI